MKRPAGLGASKKRAAASTSEKGSTKKTKVEADSSNHDAASESTIPDESLVVEATGEGAVKDLATLYEKFESASSSEEAANWLRGVMHEADRLLRSEDGEVQEEERSTVHGFYGAALLRLGLLGPELRKEGEPKTLEAWLEVALSQLDAAKDAHQHRFAWDQGLALWCSAAVAAAEDQEEQKLVQQAVAHCKALLHDKTEQTMTCFLEFAGLLLPEAEHLSLKALQALVGLLEEALTTLESGGEENDLKAVEAEGQLVLGSKAAESIAEAQEGEEENSGDEDHEINKVGRNALSKGMS